MSEVLEAAMLFCFGASWPISVVKNARAGSARSMSPSFIALILCGYLAGIAAKLLTHRFNYVLIVYLFNLAVVSVDMAVYFINRKKDMAAPNARTKEVPMNVNMRDEIARQSERYGQLNRFAHANGIVFFGSSALAALPLAELAEEFRVDEAVYNRSIPGMRVEEAVGAVENCVIALRPKKVFLHVGDEEARDPMADADEFIARYEWLLYTIHTRTDAAICVLSLLGDSVQARALNARLRRLSGECGSAFVDLSDLPGDDSQGPRLMERLRVHMRCRPIRFSDAMDMVHVS